MLKRLKIELNNALHDPSKIFRLLKRKYGAIFLWSTRYQSLREPKMKGWISDTTVKHEQIRSGLLAAGIRVASREIDLRDFREYLSTASYEAFPKYQKGGTGATFLEKALEHYIALNHLALKRDEIYIDIANDQSPVPDIYTKLRNCNAYKQDLAFPVGLHEKSIGGDAANMPIDNAFADKMAMHCSFEHFEGDSDSGFIREASRVLKPGGILCIVPLYLNDIYAIVTDPSVHPKEGIPFESDATLYCVKGYANRHGRYYDVAHFVERVVRHKGDLDLEIVEYTNARDVAPYCQLRWVAILKKPSI